MGFIARSFRNVTSAASFAPIAIQSWQSGRAQLPNTNYDTFAREGYGRNEIVFACIEELSTSAAEPRMHIRKGAEWTHDTATEPVLKLLDRPNPFMDRFEFFATIILHRSIAGNAYALKVRSGSGKVVELWLMRPDRVRVVPDRQKFIRNYEFDAGGGDSVAIPTEDVIHFRTRNPWDDFYGMPPLMPASGRIDIDNYMKDFVKSYFQSAGVPAGLLSMKTKVTDAQREEIKSRFRNDYGGPTGWHSLLVMDGNEATFTNMTASLGPSGLVVPNLDEINEARIAMVFGVPLTIIGARLGVNSSSYANKRSDRESFWDEELAPMYKSIAGPLNLSLKPDFPRVDEIAFDLSDVRALQEDIDKIHSRERSDYMAGLTTREEARLRTGRPAKSDGGTYLVPTNMQPMSEERYDEAGTDTPEPPAPIATPEPVGAGAGV